MEVFVGIAGGSGAPYARRLVQALLAGGHTVGLSFTASATKVVGHELYGDLQMDRDTVIERFVAETGIDSGNVWGVTDYGSPYASGSARWDAAVVVPCSMSTLGALAAGIEQNLVQRAANVALKERRQLVLVPRETPLSIIQLENLVRVAKAGATVLPAMPGFYAGAQTVDDLVDFVVGKVLNSLGVEQSMLGQWRDFAPAG